jgi:hypothetical protein
MGMPTSFCQLHKTLLKQNVTSASPVILSSLGFMCHPVIKSPDLLQQHTAQGKEMLNLQKGKKCVGCTEHFEGLWPITATEDRNRRAECH